MRIFTTLIITFILVSLATAQTAKSINMGYITTSTVPIPAVGLTKIAPTKVKFFLEGPCRVEYGASSDGRTIVTRVMGIVARDVELADDPIAQQLLQIGITFGQEQCPPGGGFYDDGKLKNDEHDDEGRVRKRSISLNLYYGDPVTVTAADVPKIRDAHYYHTAYDHQLDTVYGYWRDDKPGLIVNYTNYPKALKLSLAWDAQERRKQEAAVEQRRQAEQMRRNQIAANLTAFMKTNRVKRVVTMSQLAANPFIYEGQVVAFDGIFDSMTTRTTGIFVSWSGGQYVYVSGLPTSRFTQGRTMVILAGRVIGKIEVKLPGGGSRLMPHLSFVGSAFCQESGCREYGIS